MRHLGGSWATFFSRPLISLDGTSQSPSGVMGVVRNQLGLMGFPEVNFRPYDRGTNRDRSPSVLGHTVSFSFVGPTGQAGPLLDIQWVCGDGGVGPDWIELDTISPRTTAASGPISPNYAAPPRIEDLYGINTVPPSGLYVVIAMTGEPGQVGGVEGGLGDGSIGTDDLTRRAPLRSKNLSSRFEIFRVDSIVGTQRIQLDPSKKLSAYFDFPLADKAIVRLVWLIRPEAARLAQLGPTRYGFLPPERSLPSDQQPPYTSWINQDPASPIWWAGGSKQALGGEGDEYDERVAIPCERPIGQGRGALQGEPGPAPEPVGLGRWGFRHLEGLAPLPGQVVRIDRVESIGGATIWNPATSTMVQDPGLDRVTGSYEVVEVRKDLVVCRRLSEPDPTRGVPFGASEDAFWLSQPPVPNTRVLLTYTVHEPIRSLWTGLSDPDQLAQTLIEPLQTMSGPVPTGTPEAVGWSSAHADRACFDTTKGNANPGSLLDLGFRPCLFPARVGQTGQLEPDFDRPIPVGEVGFGAGRTGRWELVGSEIHLTETPIAGEGCEVCPDVRTLSTPDNPRGEVVLFASFVAAPLREGVSIFGSASPEEGIDPCAAGGVRAQAALFSERLPLPLTPQTITIPTGPDRFDLYTEAPYSPIAIPPSGVVELVRGGTEGLPLFGAPQDQASAVQYESFRAWGTPARIVLKDCTGGGKAGDTVKIDPANPATAVLRRQVDRTGSSLQIDYRGDLAYGAGVRVESLRFPGAKISLHTDRSASIQIQTQSEQALLKDLFGPVILSGCGVVATGGLTVQVGSGWALLQGRRVSVPSRLLVVPDNATSYLYLDGTTDPCNVRTLVGGKARPLPGQWDVLVARVTARVGTVTEVVPLQAPFRQLNYRFDVVVGRRDDLVYGGPAPHFDTIAEAIRYVGELVAPASGLSGYQVRILVTGPTFETEVPIRIPCEGLLIQGVAPSQGEVGWESFSYPLFDLDGRSNCIFRDLAVRYRNVGQGVINEPCRFVFVNERVGTVADSIVIDNVHLDGEGLGHGLLYTNPLKGEFRNLRLSRSTAERVTEAAIWMGSPYGAVIDQCRFVTNLAGTTILSPKAGVYLGPFGDLSPGNQIRSSYVEGFEVGVWVEGARDRLSSVTCYSTLKEGFVVGPRAGKAIRLDSCIGVDLFVSDPAPGFRSGFDIRGGIEVELISCRADLNNARPGDASIRSSQPQTRIVNFTGSQRAVVGDQTYMTGCFITEGIQAGERSVLTDCLAGWGRAGKGSILKGFIELAGGGSVLTEGQIVEGSRFQSLTVIGSGCRVCSSTIQTIQIDPSLSGGFESCEFGSFVDAEPEGMRFDCCGFAQNVQIRGSRNLFEGCRFADSANLTVRPKAGRIFYNQIRNCVFEGPKGGVYVDSDLSRIEHNDIPSEETRIGSKYSICALGDQLLCKGNRVFYGIGIGDPVGVVAAPPTTRAICEGNWIRDRLNLYAENSLLGLNYVEGPVDVTDGHQVLTGNLVVGKLTAITDNLVATGNLLLEDLVVPKTTPASFTVVGNSVRTIQADGGGADPEGGAARYKGSITGNRVRQIFTVLPDGQGRKNNTDL